MRSNIFHYVGVDRTELELGVPGREADSALISQLPFDT